MAPPSKRRKLLDPAQHVAQQQFETASKSSMPPFSHGVEHIPATKPTKSLYARPPPQLVEEVHFEIHQRSVPSVEERLRILRRQGTAALADIFSTNSDADVVVAVTATVDALGSTTALATAAVTVDVPDLPSILATSTTTDVVSDSSAESTASSAQETPTDSTSSSAEETPANSISLSAQETPADPTSSTAQESSVQPTPSSDSSQSEPASSSNNSRSSDTPSSTDAPASSTSTSDTSLPSYGVLPASENGTDDNPQNESQYQSSRESGTGSSVVPSSTTDSASAGYAAASDSAPASYGPSPSSSQETATLESSTSSNSSVPVSTPASSQSLSAQQVISATGSGYSRQTGSASSMGSFNMTTSASTSTSGSVILVSDFTASATSRTKSQATDSSSSTSSIDLNALYLLTQSNGDVSTLTRSDEPFTTSISGASEVVVPPSSSAASDSRVPASSVSEYVTTISNDETTMRSTVFSTASPSPTQSPSDDPNGVGFAGVAGDGATATTNGVSATSAPTDTNKADDEPAPAGTIAGGVVGGAAGLALVALIIMLFLRQYKKRAQLGHLALPANAAGSVAGTSGVSGPNSRGMAERAGLMPLVGAIPALFKHQNRSQQSGSETGERGFERVAGRKLPSAFSEGMTGPPHPTRSPPPSMPLVSDDSHERNLSSHSFYRDSAGFYGGDGSTATSPDPFSDTNLAATAAGSAAAGQMVMSPGPQRRPTIHAPKPNVQEPSVATSGTPSWTPSYTAAFARSETPASLDSGRNSRFTEEV